MKITGYALREAIKQHELRRDAAAGMFDGTLKKFLDDEKPTPQSVVEQFAHAEKCIARLQSARDRFNHAVSIEVAGEKYSLSEAVKIIRGLGRVEKMWRSVANPKKDPYASRDEERDPTRTFAKSTITQQEAMKLASAATKRAGAMRSAIALANSKEVDLENLDPALFE